MAGAVLAKMLGGCLVEDEEEMRRLREGRSEAARIVGLAFCRSAMANRKLG